MSERALLARFDLVADNPENIPLLRHYIVDLAIRGKLLEKSALDISVPEMLERIEAKTDLLVKQGKLKKQKPLAAISAEELPATYIAHCAFARLGNVANLQKGLTGIQSAIPGKFPLVVTAAARSTCDHFDFDGAAAIVPMVSSTGHGHASLNRLHYQEGKFALGTILCAVFPIDEELISARFLFEYLTAFKDDLLVSKMNGTANVTLTVGKIAEVPVPIIAPAVQQRVNELMALCDQLEAAQDEREARRDRLVAASLHRIGTAPATADEAETCSEITTPLPEAARFHLAHLPRLTTRPEHIKQLRQTILNLAVRGRLVPQDPNDEPAAELLKRVQVEKAQLLLQRRIQRDMDVEYSTSIDEEIAPKEWCWVYASDIALIQGGKRLPAGATFSKEKTPHIYIRVTDMKDGSIRTSDPQFITPEIHRAIAKYTINKEDIYITIAGTIGQVGRVPALLDGQNLTENAAKIVFREIDADFFVMVLSSEAVQLQFQDKTKQMAQPKLALKRIAGARIPLPPLAEQHRIVAKVDEMMALCDQLEAQLTTTQTDSRRLLEVLLHEALAA